MAQLKKIVRSNPTSNFTQVAPDGGATFRVLADGLNQLYERVAPAAIDQMEREGQEYGREMARRDLGNDGFTGGAGTDNLAGGNYRDAIASIESRGSGDYQAIGPTHPKLGRALGRYQIMEANIGPWSKAALGREVSADEFLASDEIQDAIFDHSFGGYVAKYGERGAAQAWFAGPGGVGKEDRKDVLGTTVGDYGDRFVAAMQGGAGDAALDGGETGVTIRTPDGSMQLRKYSPYAGPILRAHDVAAQVAYQAETINQASVSLQQLSQQYELDPEGYDAAAKSYIDQVIESAPAEVRGDLRGTLETSVIRTRMGIMDAKHRDTRKRADNSSRALVNRWSDELAQAIATGDPAEINAAQQKLDNVLQAREALPGVAWTPEQSENVFIKSERAAQSLIKKRRTERDAQYKGDLNLIIDAAKAGRQAEGEELLQNPEAVAMHPELAREAAAFVALRDNSPEFLSMTPDQQAAEVARIMAAPVAEEWEIDVADAAAKMAKENRTAWDKDPVKRASEVLETPPPPLPDLTPEDPSKFVDALAARREYMNGVRAAGYTDTNAFLSEEEADQLGVLMSKGTDPAIRAAMSGAIVAGFGPDAVRVFDEIGGDRVTMFAGKMQAFGGRPQVAQAILQGQQMLSENMVQLPPKSDRITAFDGQVATAFQGIPGAIEAQAEIMDAAKALYASQAQGIDPTSEAASDLMKQSIQTVLGQTKNKRGELTGGVQSVMGHQTLLPMGVTGGSVEQALRSGLGLGTYTVMGMVDTGINEDLWAAAGVEGVPSINGEPIPRRYIDNDMVRPVSIGGNLYRLELTNGATKLDVEDSNGNVMIFDLMKFMEAAE